MLADIPPYPKMNANQSITFFDTQFQKQVAGGDFALNPFLILVLLRVLRALSAKFLYMRFARRIPPCESLDQVRCRNVPPLIMSR